MPFEWVDQPKQPVVYEVGEGWIPLIRELESLLRSISPDYKIVQVKEKFGGLRYYADYVPAPGAPVEHAKIFAALIRMWEGMSFSVCEECGQYGESTRGKDHLHWVKTLCDHHRQVRVQRYRPG